MSYKIGNTFISIHSNVNILEPKRKSFRGCISYGEKQQQLLGYNGQRKVKTAYDVLFVSFSCHRIVLT